MFDAWADSIELPHGRVHGEPQPCDGVYVVHERGRYVVFVQERGVRVFECGEFADYVHAKRRALASEYLYGITLRAS